MKKVPPVSLRTITLERLESEREEIRTAFTALLGELTETSHRAEDVLARLRKKVRQKKVVHLVKHR